MKRGKYSKIADFRIVNFLTKAYIKYYNLPNDKNHFFHRHSFFREIIKPNKNNKNQIRLETTYITTLNRLINFFNQNIQTKICRLSKQNVFAFLLVVSEVCLKNNLEKEYQNYLYDTKNNLEDLENKLTLCFNEAIKSIFLCHNTNIPFLDISSLNMEEKKISSLTMEDKKNLLKLILILKFNKFNINSNDLKA